MLSPELEKTLQRAVDDVRDRQHEYLQLEHLLFVDRDLAYELLWNFVRTLSNRLRETNDKMTFLAASSRF